MCIRIHIFTLGWSERGSTKDKHLCKKNQQDLWWWLRWCVDVIYLLKYPFLSFIFLESYFFLSILLFVCSSFFNSFSVRKWCNPVYYCLRESNGIAFVTILAAVLWKWWWWWWAEKKWLSPKGTLIYQVKDGSIWRQGLKMSRQ